MMNFYDGIRASNLFKKYMVDDMMFVEYTCEPGDARTRIWSHCNYITYVVSSRMTLKFLDRDYLIEAGNCYFVKKGGCIVYQHDDDVEFCDLIIFIPDEFIRSVLNKYQLKLKRDKEIEVEKVIPLNFDKALDGYYHSMFAYLQSKKPPSETLLRIKFEELIVNLLNNPENLSLLNYVDELCQEGKISIRQIMESNYCCNLNLEDFARLSARSLSAFRRDFVEIYGMPPGQWLREKRLAYSRHLLQSTEKKIDDILYESGFRNRSHFIKVFKQKFGMTPRRYRKGLG